MSKIINAISVISIPNGLLHKHYGDDILQAGKGGWEKSNDIRYNFAKEPRFKLLSERYKKDIFRIELLCLNKTMTIKDLIGKDLNIKPHKII